MVKYCHPFAGISPDLGQEIFASVIKENTELLTVHAVRCHQRNTDLFNLLQYNKNYTLCNVGKNLFVNSVESIKKLLVSE
jgi:hypothetical protein